RAALEAGEGVAAASGDTRPTSQYRAALAAALAEADLAEGDVAAGLARYRAAIEEAVGVHGTESAAALDPYLSLLAAAAAGAHAEHGEPGRARELADLLRRAVVPRFTTGMSGRDGVVDLPVAGALLLALAAVDIGAGTPAGGRDTAWDLALARRANARLDYPSMNLNLWTKNARLVLGDDV